jgi:hypothetical protein
VQKVNTKDEDVLFTPFTCISFAASSSEFDPKLSWELHSEPDSELSTVTLAFPASSERAIRFGRTAGIGLSALLRFAFSGFSRSALTPLLGVVASSAPGNLGGLTRARSTFNWEVHD